MVEVGRDLLRPSGPVPPLKQGHIELIAQDLAQMAFEWLQGWRLNKVSAQFMPVLSHSHNKKQFPDVQKEIRMFQFVPTAQVLSVSTTEDSLGPSSL